MSHIVSSLVVTNVNCHYNEVTILIPPLLALWLVCELMCEKRRYKLNGNQKTFGAFKDSDNKYGTIRVD